jgi:hypothetical protein
LENVVFAKSTYTNRERFHLHGSENLTTDGERSLPVSFVLGNDLELEKANLDEQLADRSEFELGR